ncbi:MAG: insulinase family protein [Xanthomonadales bacterium]|nr:insulinase family protein [Gammaproteobacteria bacterium]MBT8053392.1 insulinase family protein [Gammaproteobacteria bacterium]NND57000.1 insulinase family protein [Xanthomonadales bacterium]NNK50813.1 insulinase family protein [Xanthomonadales bacterium]
MAFGLLIGGCEPQPAAEQTPVEPAPDAVQEPAASETAGPSISYEKYRLDNGLDVILHVDRSDPVVAINLAAHVGSSREVTGRTGFAHLFEHLLFLDSENLGYGGLDEMNTRIGGEGTNGFTTTDMTQYFQAVPADALEKVVWAEADKLGYFINTVTQPVIDVEKQVVKNEKRQRVDNRPYGHNFYVIGKAMYPQDHPYNWQVIGSLADLEAATLEDVKTFYSRWYVPNNVTLTLSGDFDVAEAKALIEKYFGEIPAGPEVALREPRPVELKENISLYHEDNFATVPRLTMVWPSVGEFHPDAAAFEILSEYLSEGKRAPLNEVLIDELKLTSSLSTFNYGKELAGEFYLFVDANAGEDLDGLLPALDTAFDRFEKNGISQKDLDRIKAGYEVAFYGQLQSVLGKAIALGQYNTLTGDPERINSDIRRLQAVTTEDVMRVYNTYIKDRPHVATSFVPKGEPALTLEGSVEAAVVEETVVQGAEAAPEADRTVRDFESTPSSFDRTVEPPFGNPYELPAPAVWRETLENGVAVFGIESTETPLVYFSLELDAGRDRSSVAKPAVASLTADLLNKGTANRSTAELEDAIKSLGSDIRISAGSTSTRVSGSTLSRNFEKTMALVEEMLLEPRWDSEEFELLKRKQINQIDQDAGNPEAIARREAAKLRYPADHIYSYLPYGTRDKLEAVTLADLQAFYGANYSPVRARLNVVGDVGAAAVRTAASGLAARWKSPQTDPVSLPPAKPVPQSALYLYDVPGAKQSVLRIQRPSLSALDPDYPLAEALNFLLGGIYTSELNTELRVNKGYTYGIRSGFSGEKDRGTFAIGSSVRANVTRESLELIRDIVAGYGPEFTAEDLAVLKGAVLRGQALKNETLSAKLNVVRNISRFGYPDDYQARNAQRVEEMTLEQFKQLAGKYLRADAMQYLVVGDAATQAERLGDLGFGAPVMLPAIN